MSKILRMPSLFCAHGSPMNVLADNAFTRSLKVLGEFLPRPEAIIVVSAHWLTYGTYFTCSAKPPMIYDFYGFPSELYAIKYPSPGSSKVAERAAALLSSVGAQCDSERGIDHAAWTILHHIFPKADIPVIEMSIDILQPVQHHYDLGKMLRPLRDEGVLLVGSGNIVHNLMMIDFHDTDALPYDWAVEFDEAVKNALIADDHESLMNYEILSSGSNLANPKEDRFIPMVHDHNLTAASALAIPTNDHYLPMIYILGTQHAAQKARFVHEAIQNASISMRSFLYE